MNELFQVEVLKKEAADLCLKVTIVNPQQDVIYSQKNFALQLLWRYSDYNNDKKFPLYKHISEEQILNKLWVFSNDYKFIHTIKIIKTENYPLSPQIKSLGDEQWKSFWKAGKNLPAAEMLIVVTKEDWIEHLLVGEIWLTRAIDYDFV